MPYISLSRRREFQKNYIRDYRLGKLRGKKMPQTKEERRAVVKAYYLKNRERILRQARERYPAYREKHKVNARRHQVKLYGLTLEAYELMYKNQNGSCLICSKKMEILNIDHDHFSGRVRGLLCRPCNHGLGMFKDNIDLLMKAKLYLERMAP